MELVPINRCVNSEVRFYGLKAYGLALGVCLMIIVWSKTSIIFGIIASAIGYLIGDSFSKYWHVGNIQKFLYWHCNLRPTKMCGSHLRRFI